MRVAQARRVRHDPGEWCAGLPIVALRRERRTAATGCRRRARLAERVEDVIQAPVPFSFDARKASLLEPAHLGPKKAKDAGAKLWRRRPERMLQATGVGSRLLAQDETLEQGLQAARKTVERRSEPGRLQRRGAAARSPSGAARRASSGGGGIGHSAGGDGIRRRARRGRDRPRLACDARDDGRDRVHRTSGSPRGAHCSQARATPAPRGRRSSVSRTSLVPAFADAEGWTKKSFQIELLSLPAGGCRKLPRAPGNPRRPPHEKPRSRRESPPIPAYPVSAMTGLSRRRSRVRVPSLPSKKTLLIAGFSSSHFASEGNEWRGWKPFWKRQPRKPR